MKSILLGTFLLTAAFAQAQNVGVGTTIPATKLHVIGPDAGFTNTNATVENISPTGAAGLKLTTATVGADFTRYGSSSAISTFGIPPANLARIFNVGPILVGASGANKLYLGTNSLVRMMFDENGLAGFNSTIDPNTQLTVGTALRNGLFVSNNTASPGLAFGVNSQILSTVGSAIAGSAYPNSESISPFESGSYGVLGSAGNTGRAGGFFSLGGIALRAKSTTGLALSTTGNLRLAGIGEAAGRVLTCDASGNATWQDASSGSSTWTVSGNNIYSSNFGNVGIGTTVPATKLQVLETNGEDAIRGSSANTSSGSGVYGSSTAPRSGAFGYAGLTGYNTNTGTDRFGVIGISDGTSSASLPSAGVGGYGDYGVLGFSQSTTGAGMIAQSGSGKTALELNNGYIKVSGTNKAAFIHVATASNSSAAITTLNYPDQSASDILIVTQNWSAGAGGGFYNDSPVGVYFDGVHWNIFNEHTSLAIAGAAFNVMVIKQ